MLPKSMRLKVKYPTLTIWIKKTDFHAKISHTEKNILLLLIKINLGAK